MNLPIYHTPLIVILAAAVLANHTAKEHAYKSQHETILVDLNQYTATTRLVMI